MGEKLSERLEARLALRAGVPDFIKEPAYVDSEECRALLREAAELARSVEDAAVVEINSDADDVRLIAEGGPLDRMATSLRVIGMHGQRVRLVPEPPEAE